MTDAAPRTCSRAYDKGVLLADSAYDSDKLRDTLEARGAWANIKPMPHRLNPPKFSKRLYRERNNESVT